MINVTLTKLKSNHENLRTDVIKGVIPNIPQIGDCLNLYGEGLEFGTRAVYTTEIKEIEMNDEGMIFKTQNSTYKLEFGEKEDEQQL